MGPCHAPPMPCMPSVPEAAIGVMVLSWLCHMVLFLPQFCAVLPAQPCEGRRRDCLQWGHQMQQRSLSIGTVMHGIMHGLYHHAWHNAWYHGQYYACKMHGTMHSIMYGIMHGTMHAIAHGMVHCMVSCMV